MTSPLRCLAEHMARSSKDYGIDAARVAEGYATLAQQVTVLRASLRDCLDALETSPDDLDVYEYEIIVDGAKNQARFALKGCESP